MTVTDLIEYLQKLPKDTVIGVVFQMHSDLSVLDENDIQFYDKARYDREQHQYQYPISMNTKRFVLRNGQIMKYDERTWDKAETPKFVPVLIFPGN